MPYLREIDGGADPLRFNYGEGNVPALLSEPTAPQLEIGETVLAVEMEGLMLVKIDLQPNNVKFYCNCKVIQGYIHNKTKRFYVHVHNQIQRIP